MRSGAVSSIPARLLLLAALLSIVSPQVALALSPEAVTDSMSDEEIRAYRTQHILELKSRARAFHTRKMGRERTYPGIFFCTIYYTPKQSGFTAERGFDVTPVRARGLRGREYPRSFLQAVKKEGFGRLDTPVDGHSYIRYDAGRFHFAKAPLGSRGNVLIPRRSCAISPRNRYLRQRMKLSIQSEAVSECTGSTEWEVADVGGVVHPLQIDLYWGEDEPRGPFGRQTARPRGTWLEYSFETVVIAR
jgi:hypothetical protein